MRQTREDSAAGCGCSTNGARALPIRLAHETQRQLLSAMRMRAPWHLRLHCSLGERERSLLGEVFSVHATWACESTRKRASARILTRAAVVMAALVVAAAVVNRASLRGACGRAHVYGNAPRTSTAMRRARWMTHARASCARTARANCARLIARAQRNGCEIRQR